MSEETKMRTFCDGCAKDKAPFVRFEVCVECVNAANNKTALNLDRERLDWLDQWLPKMDDLYLTVLSKPELRSRLEATKFQGGGGVRAMIDLIRAHLSGAVS